MKTYATTEHSRIKRKPVRAHYDQETVHAILDATYLCHVGFSDGERPFVIPTAYGRSGEDIVLHGSRASRLMKLAAQGQRLSIAVTLMDGLVLARSAMHHSINYRSVVLFGTGRAIENRKQKEALLEAFVEHVLPGRSKETRVPTAKELDATAVVCVRIEEASAKIRSGPPVDDEEDYSLPHWAGVLPFDHRYGPPLPDPRLAPGCALPESIRTGAAP